MAIDIFALLDYGIFQNTVKEWVLALIVFVTSYFLLKAFKFVGLKRLKAVSKKSKTKLDDVLVKAIDHIGWPFYILIACYASLKFLVLPSYIDRYLNYGILILLTFYVVRALQYLVEFGTNKIIEKREDTDTSIVQFLSKLLKGILWLLAALLTLSNLGYNVSSLVAGLGIGGIAIALALQNILGDLFSSISIYFDKPFEVGDFIIIGEHLGVVKKIGIKTTRLQSLWGEEIVVSNKELTSIRIRNYKKMEKRRIHFNFGLIYQTSTEKLRKVNEIVKDIFSKIEHADLDRVHFKEFGDSSLNFEVAYYVDTGDYNEYMDIQQEINIQLKERLEKEGMDFAYPTQTVFLEK